MKIDASLLFNMWLIIHNFSADTALVLGNVRFSVFALGSSAYPNFCAFGLFLDNILGDLGGERIHPLGKGDELGGQEESFLTWSTTVYQVKHLNIDKDNLFVIIIIITHLKHMWSCLLAPESL